MKAIEQAIRDAMEKGGYEVITDFDLESFPSIFVNSFYFIDPAFWQAIGKARGDGHSKVFDADSVTMHMYADGTLEPMWEFRWHQFIHHLAAGKDAESFFKDLIPDEKEI